MTIKEHMSKRPEKRNPREVGREGEPVPAETGIEPTVAAEPTAMAPTAEPVARTAVNPPRRLNTRELAVERHQSREQVEELLARLGLRGANDDGSTLYDVAQLDQLLTQEDRQNIARAAELLDLYPPEIAAWLAAQTINDLREQWLIESGLHETALRSTEAVQRIFRKLHSVRAGASPDWPRAVAIAEFEVQLRLALAARRAEKGG